jgi:hypothetical protein
MLCVTIALGIAIAVNCSSSAVSQTPQEVFSQNSFAVKRFGNSERGQAIYFIGMGLNELKFLNSQSRELSDEQENRRVLGMSH